jgi:ribonuclease HI
MGFMIEIYTDGACSGNPGKGGWGALLRCDGAEKELSGYEPMTTNNRMEMMGVIKALEALKKPSTATIYSDSQYVIKGMTEWLKGWKAKGWKTASKDPVKNVDLWQQLDALAAKHTLKWQWVKGHNDHPENERVDALARAAIVVGK